MNRKDSYTGFIITYYYMSILSDKTIKVLEAIKKLGPTYQREIAKETGLSDTTINAILKNLTEVNIIKSKPAKDKDSGRLIKKIELVIKTSDLDKIVNNYKMAQAGLDDALVALSRPKNE
jgi:transcription initiation factor IIE alpha subunit